MYLNVESRYHGRKGNFFTENVVVITKKINECMKIVKMYRYFYLKIVCYRKENSRIFGRISGIQPYRKFGRISAFQINRISGRPDI